MKRPILILCFLLCVLSFAGQSFASYVIAEVKFDWANLSIEGNISSWSYQYTDTYAMAVQGGGDPLTSSASSNDWDTVLESKATLSEASSASGFDGSYLYANSNVGPYGVLLPYSISYVERGGYFTASEEVKISIPYTIFYEASASSDSNAHAEFQILIEAWLGNYSGASLYYYEVYKDLYAGEYIKESFSDTIELSLEFSPNQDGYFVLSAKVDPSAYSEVPLPSAMTLLGMGFPFILLSRKKFLKESNRGKL